MAENELQHVHTLLLQLQDVLREKFSLESEIEALPANLREKENALNIANSKYRIPLIMLSTGGTT